MGCWTTSEGDGLRVIGEDSRRGRLSDAIPVPTVSNADTVFDPGPEVKDGGGGA